MYVGFLCMFLCILFLLEYKRLHNCLRLKKQVSWTNFLLWWPQTTQVSSGKSTKQTQRISQLFPVTESQSFLEQICRLQNKQHKVTPSLPWCVHRQGLCMQQPPIKTQLKGNSGWLVSIEVSHVVSVTCGDRDLVKPDPPVLRREVKHKSVRGCELYC